MKTLAYLVYGNKREYALELSYSVASAVRKLHQRDSDIRILLITDDSNRREDLPVDHLIFTDDQFSNWTQGGTYNHAAKVHALMWAMDHCDSPVALIDTDTYFTRHPDEIFSHVAPGKTVMQASDGQIGIYDEWQDLLTASPPMVAEYPITTTSEMYNSGVIGVDQSDRDALTEIIPLMDELYAISPVFNIEQFAVTCVLKRHTEIHLATDTIQHYWPYHERAFVHAGLDEAFPELSSENFDRIVNSFTEFRMPPKAISSKFRSRFKGIVHGWDHNYRFAYLSALSAYSSQDTANANAWAAIAAQLVSKGGYPTDIVRKDFQRMISGTEDWMNERTSQMWNEFA